MPSALWPSASSGSSAVPESVSRYELTSMPMFGCLACQCRMPGITSSMPRRLRTPARPGDGAPRKHVDRARPVRPRRPTGAELDDELARGVIAERRDLVLVGEEHVHAPGPA